MLVEGFFRQTKGPLQRLSHRLLGPLAGLGEGSIEEDLGSGSLSPLLWLPIIGRLRHTPHPGSRAPHGDPYFLQIVSHDVTARPVQLQCVSWVLNHPKSVAALGPCLRLQLSAMPFLPTVPVASSSVPQNPGAPPPQTCPLHPLSTVTTPSLSTQGPVFLLCIVFSCRYSFIIVPRLAGLPASIKYKLYA